MHIVVMGNPADGFQYFGPFDSDDEAIKWAEVECGEEHWWVTELEAPTSSEEHSEE